MSRFLAPFNPNATCSKCGHDQVSMSWERATGDFAREFIGFEWLVRLCERCGYDWKEQCLDTTVTDAAAH
jgi:predicted nucleic-acid-binding Zn-ribbon protein